MESVTQTTLPLDQLDLNEPFQRVVAETIHTILELPNPINSFAVTWSYARVKIAEGVWQKLIGPLSRQRTARKPIISTRLRPYPPG